VQQWCLSSVCGNEDRGHIVVAPAKSDVIGGWPTASAVTCSCCHTRVIWCVRSQAAAVAVRTTARVAATVRAEWATVPTIARPTAAAPTTTRGQSSARAWAATVAAHRIARIAATSSKTVTTEAPVAHEEVEPTTTGPATGMVAVRSALATARLPTAAAPWASVRAAAPTCIRRGDMAGCWRGGVPRDQ
jgi:hypothetical protein